MGLPPQAGTDAATAHPSGGADARPALSVFLQPLAASDPLRHKWQLGEGLPPSSPEHWQQHEAQQKEEDTHAGHLKLSSQPESGERWECRVPFTDLARDGGLVLGTCPQSADIVLPHPGVSQRHALLEIAETGLVITALCPHRDTHVNQQALSPYDRRVPLSHGSDLLLGKANLRLEYIH